MDIDRLGKTHSFPVWVFEILYDGPLICRLVLVLKCVRAKHSKKKKKKHTVLSTLRSRSICRVWSGCTSASTPPPRSRIIGITVGEIGRRTTSAATAAVVSRIMISRTKRRHRRGSSKRGSAPLLYGLSKVSIRRDLRMMTIFNQAGGIILRSISTSGGHLIIIIIFSFFSFFCRPTIHLPSLVILVIPRGRRTARSGRKNRKSLTEFASRPSITTTGFASSMLYQTCHGGSGHTGLNLTLSAMRFAPSIGRCC